MVFIEKADTAFTLIAEAKDVGLLDRGIAPDALDIAIEHLRRLMETPAKKRMR